MQAQQKTTASKSKAETSAEHHTQAAECCTKAAAEHNQAAKYCTSGDDKKAEMHAKNAHDHCMKVQDHAKQAASA
jgi:hypothetical protein